MTIPSDPNTTKDPRKIINYFSKNNHKSLKIWGFGVLGIEAVDLIEKSVQSIDKEKVKRCAKFGLSMIEI